MHVKASKPDQNDALGATNFMIGGEEVGSDHLGDFCRANQEDAELVCHPNIYTSIISIVHTPLTTD